MFYNIISQNAKGHIPGLLKPVIDCTGDHDSRIRYFACESLYNTIKVIRSDALVFFNELFDALSQVCMLFTLKIKYLNVF